VTTSTVSLTRRQKAVYDFIRGYVRGEGFAPSYREIGDACGLASISSVAHSVDALVSAGYLRRRTGQPRSLVVVDLFDEQKAAAVPVIDMDNLPPINLNERKTRGAGNPWSGKP